MSNLVSIKDKFILEIINSGADYTVEELEAMSLVEVRDIRDEEIPTIITAVQGTCNGKSVTYTKLKAA